jgi:hypothetical protein
VCHWETTDGETEVTLLLLATLYFQAIIRAPVSYLKYGKFVISALDLPNGGQFLKLARGSRPDAWMIEASSSTGLLLTPQDPCHQIRDAITRECHRAGFLRPISEVFNGITGDKSTGDAVEYFTDCLKKVSRSVPTSLICVRWLGSCGVKHRRATSRYAENGTLIIHA